MKTKGCRIAARAAAALLFGGWLGLASTASAAPPAAFSTTNTAVDGTGHCKNGNENVNCNIYDGKAFVWMNGGPVNANLGDGTFFFAVLDPGGQNSPNDGTTGNLSDDYDAYTNRTFSVSGGTVSYGGSHDFDSNKIRLLPYADTPNPGGVYILAICSLASGYPVDPSNCKYDAFKIVSQDALVVRACKFDDANGNGLKASDEALLSGWVITATGVLDGSGNVGTVSTATELSGNDQGCAVFTVKDKDAVVTMTETTQNGWLQTAPLSTADYGGYTGSASGVASLTNPIVNGTTVYFGNYNLLTGGQVDVTKDATPRVQFGWDVSKAVDKTVVKQVGGSATFNYTVTVTYDAGTWTASGNITVLNSTIVTVSGLKVVDTIDNGGTCKVTGAAGNGTASGNDWVGLSVLPGGTENLTYACTFPTLTLTTTGKNTVSVRLSDDTEIAVNEASYGFNNVTPIDGCVSVSDKFNNVTGSLGNVCVGVDVGPKAFTYSRTIPVPAFDCLTYNNTATTTTNTTGTIDTASQSVQVCGPAKTGALTKGFWQNKNGQGIIGGGASTAYVCNSGKWLRDNFAPFQEAALSATATCAQVAKYVFDIVKAADASGASMNAMLKAQMLATALDVYFSDAALGGNKIGAPGPIGAVGIDLTKICKDIGACSVYENVSSSFGGATSLTVSQMLSYAASQSNAGGTAWYGQVKAVQELAKDAFDAINNQRAFAAP